MGPDMDQMLAEIRRKGDERRELNGELLALVEYGFDAYGILRKLLEFADDEAARKVVEHYNKIIGDKD